MSESCQTTEAGKGTWPDGAFEAVGTRIGSGEIVVYDRGPMRKSSSLLIGRRRSKVPYRLTAKGCEHLGSMNVCCLQR